jgi:Tfp pilus assembly protein PilN
MIFDAIKRVLSAFSGNRLVSIELGEKTVRAVMVKKAGRQVEVTRALSAERTVPDPAGAIEHLLDADGGFKGPAILVTDQVKFLASELTVDGADKLPQEKLNAAAKWEIEPYLDFHLSSGLFACRLLKDLATEEATPALIFAMDRGRYGQLAKRLKSRGLDLRRAYCPEGALARAVQLPAAGSHKIVVGCDANALKGVLLTADGPSVFQDLPLIEGAAPDDEAVRGMLYDLTPAEGDVEEIVLAGDAVTPAMSDGLAAEFAHLRRWGDNDVGDLAAGVDRTAFDTGYAGVLGAAFQELDRTGAPPLGVTDRVPIASRIQQVFQKDKRLAPALVVGLLLAGLLGHHMLTRSAIARYQSQIQHLKKEKQKLLFPREEKQRLTKVLEEIRSRRTYLETELAAGNGNLMGLLATVSAALPPDVVLNRLYQKGSGSFWIEGNAFMGKSVYAFNEALSRIEGCKSTNLETIRRVENASDARQKLLPYGFAINITF